MYVSAETLGPTCIHKLAHRMGPHRLASCRSNGDYFTLEANVAGGKPKLDLPQTVTTPQQQAVSRERCKAMRDRDGACCPPLGMGGQLKSAMYLLLAGRLRQTLYARLLPFRSLHFPNSKTYLSYTCTKASCLTHQTCWLCCLLDMNMHIIIHMVQAVQSNMRQDSLTPPQVWVDVCFE